MKDYLKLSIEMHKKFNGKLEIKSKVPLENRDDLSTVYSPGVAGPCLEISKDKKNAFKLTSAKKTIGIISDGTAVLGLGNIGPDAAIPVMEGKALLFKKFAGLDAFPIVLNAKSTDEIVNAVKAIAPSFGGINLEDISAPNAFEVEDRLKKELDIPVFHDDQHGTAIVVLAGLINALKVVNKGKEAKIVVNGAGAAGIAVVKLLHKYGFKDIIVCDSKGIISNERGDLNNSKKEILSYSNKNNLSGNLLQAMKGSDIFVGVSKGDLLKKEHIKAMNKKPIVFALANPRAELAPELAQEYNIEVFATGRSDYPNQINNVLAFPGIFKGAIEAKAKNISEKMLIEAAKALSNLVKFPTASKIIPGPFESDIASIIAEAVKKAV